MTDFHVLKLRREYAAAVLAGSKTFEVREKRDRDFKVGDIVQFVVVEPDDKTSVTTALNRCLFRIRYVLNDFCGLAPGYVAFSIERLVGELSHES